MKRNGRNKICIGAFFLILSGLGFFCLETDHAKTIGIFKSVAIMTSEPIALVMVALFLAGLIFITVGIVSIATAVRRKKQSIDETTSGRLSSAGPFDFDNSPLLF